MSFRLSNEARNRTVEMCARLFWQLEFACENGHSGRIGSQDLLARFPAGVTLEQIAERLVCKTCGSRDGSLTIGQDVSASSAREIGRFNESDKYRER